MTHESCTCRAPVYIAKTRPASPSAPTGASYKRKEDGIVLVNPETCIGCKLCSWACPYGAREYDHAEGVMKKCTLCADRIYNENLVEEDRIPACVRACPTGAAIRVSPEKFVEFVSRAARSE